MTLYAFENVRPELPEDGDFWVAPDANVIGRVILRSGASIWFGCTLRGDNEVIEIGVGSNVQENVVMHTDLGCPLTVGQNCTIGHKAMLHGCTIGDNTLIGMGATVLNRAVIGKNCLIGAGALVTEDKVIPDHSMVLGSPGKVVKTLGPDWEARLIASAQGYQDKMRRFRSGLVALD
ncbi:gamma carbonic anhydrase family protein [Pseudooceanicola sp.]|uniref:gamma carbonic anhydrase family protein n=1 Tax=Pseudooceanicola sp. TaxID=1914328 RepID=UPI00261A8ED0|nr:gamma carbonic anhydrase family protein [Pseudooceanicola sp.]MDF1856803.1 gamma carbonic anhydrase family protein [Pseudooceanicola sp.]